ncbi:uncharacterized protein G2W53_025478 [Senna tora]|uniref:Uncharacterized protein n=1 Tax=Senna tora TaxID=362788 RepID=A0A834WGI4_9FABA|nr:uncharacterized protein G2W53_025478 [Senna tora]
MAVACMVGLANASPRLAHSKLAQREAGLTEQREPSAHNGGGITGRSIPAH